MARRPPIRPALPVWFCGAMLVALALTVFPMHSSEVGTRLASHRAEVAAATSLARAMAGGPSKPEKRKCRPSVKATGSVLLAAEGIDPVHSPGLASLPIRAPWLSSDPYVAAQQTAFAGFLTLAQRSRSPPAWPS